MEESTISVSKGVFVFKNGATRAKNRPKNAKSPKKSKSLLGADFENQPFYKAYSENWNKIKNHIQNIQKDRHNKTMDDLVNFVENSYANNIDNILPAAALLAGINQPDHYEQFHTLSQKITEDRNARAVVLQSRDCPNIKSTIELMVSGFIEESYDEDDEYEQIKLRRSQYTLPVLEAWYKSDDHPEGMILAVIITDFECFNEKVLQDFILILSSYCSSLPFVLVLGVATAVSALHSGLPYHVTSKIYIKIFQTQPASHGLNQLIENVILSPAYPFRLSGRTFKFLTDIFLFYDFSINGFIQGFKFCMIEHYFRGKIYALCDSYHESIKLIKTFDHEDLEAIRHLMSFRPYVESLTDCKEVISILTDDEFLRKKLPKLLRDCHVYIIIQRIFLEFFKVVIEDLPKQPLGRQIRELYPIIASANVTETSEFKEIWQMLSFLSRDDFVSKFARATDVIDNFMEINLDTDDISKEAAEVVIEKMDILNEYLEKISEAGLEAVAKNTTTEELKPVNRQELKLKLIEMSKKEKTANEFTKLVASTLDFIKCEIVEKHLQPFNKGSPPLIELFVFSDTTTIRQHLVGSPRAALNTALNNPQIYLGCDCCKLEDEAEIIPSLPDISIAYKLHKECGKMINLYDWLQSFRTIAEDKELENEDVDPEIQARFTRAVAELQFLGFIKASKRKTDHVAKLTW